MFRYLLSFFPQSESSESVAEERILPNELWLLIFSNVPPEFALELTRVSKLFHKLVTENLYPEIRRKFFLDSDKEEKLFALYRKRFVAFLDPTLYELFAHIEAGKWEEISNLDLNPITFSNWSDGGMTSTGMDLLTYVNSKHNQMLRDIVFSAIKRGV